MYMALFSTNTLLGVTGWLNRHGVGLHVLGIVLAVPLSGLAVSGPRHNMPPESKADHPSTHGLVSSSSA